MPVARQFIGDSLLRVGDTDFHYEHPLSQAPSDRLGIEKERPLLEAYLALWDELAPRRIVELGIRFGGSTAMLHALGGVERVVSLELREQRIESLDRYIAAAGAAGVVHPYFGVDQSDRATVARIVDGEFGGAPLDLVIDDASHRYRESRASFEVLFPRVRPGGLYLVEDWRWQHMVAAGVAAAVERDDAVRREIERRVLDENRVAPDTPLSRLVIELILARSVSDDVVAEVVVGPDWAAVRRGPAELDPATFRLDDHAPDHLALLTPVR